MGQTPTGDAAQPCPICHGARWVCEDHPSLPWQHDDCGGAGGPCACNPKGLVDWLVIYKKVESD